LYTTPLYSVWVVSDSLTIGCEIRTLQVWLIDLCGSQQTESGKTTKMRMGRVWSSYVRISGDKLRFLRESFTPFEAF